MGVFKDENAITYRLTKMQKLWVETITPKTKLARWLIDQDEDRMVKAFALTEASEHGKISQLFIILETTFEDIDTYGKKLTQDFINVWNDPAARKEVEHANVLPQWDSSPYQQLQNKNSHQTFIDCLSSFTKSISKEEQMVIYLAPYVYNGDPQWVQWIKKVVEILPNNLKLMVTDIKSHQIFEYINEKQMTTLDANLDMQGAIKELIQAGDTNNPAVGVNQCIVNMVEASERKNVDGINKWGEEGLELAKKTGFPSIEATVLLAYGSAFYQMKKLNRALEIYAEAEAKSIEGIAKEDPTAKALLLQAYHFQAAAYLYKRKKEKAFLFYTKTAKEAKEQNNTLLYLETSRQAAYIARKRYKKEEALEILKEAFDVGKQLDIEIMKFSSMLLICHELLTIADDYDEEVLQKEVNNLATQTWGEHWQDMSQKEAYENILTD